MSSTRQCPKCGATIPVGGLGGLCPRCVTRVSLRGPTPGSTTGPTPETSGEGLFEDYVLLEEIGPEFEDCVREAVEVCPTEAISFTED